MQLQNINLHSNPPMAGFFSIAQGSKLFRDKNAYQVNMRVDITLKFYPIIISSIRRRKLA